MPAEASQEQGRKGVALVKRWLEATTFIELPWNVYEHTPGCTVTHLAGIKRFDLAGYFLLGAKQQVVVENKNVTTESNQYPEFLEFLAIAYSATVKAKEEHTDMGREFMWVTTHPFKTARWTSFETHGEIEAALAAYPGYLAEREIDEDIVREVAARIWVLVLNRKQERITLSVAEIIKAQDALSRKESTL